MKRKLGHKAYLHSLEQDSQSQHLDAEVFGWVAECVKEGILVLRTYVRTSVGREEGFSGALTTRPDRRHAVQTRSRLTVPSSRIVAR